MSCREYHDCCSSTLVVLDCTANNPRVGLLSLNPPSLPSFNSIKEPFIHQAMASTLQKLTSVVHQATAKHSATVIFIHGLGDSGHGWQVILSPFHTLYLFTVGET